MDANLISVVAAEYAAAPSWPESVLSDIRLVVPDWFTYAAVFINGLAGAAFAARRGLDLVGVVGLAIAQGLGGLLLLTTLLQTGVPFVLRDPWYIVWAVLAGLIGFFFASLIVQALRFAIVLDGLALGMLTAIGVTRSQIVDLPPATAVFLGVLTGIGGLVLRDVLAGAAPTVLRPGIWVGVASLAGATLMVSFDAIGLPRSTQQWICVAVVAVLRTASAVFNLRTSTAERRREQAIRAWEAGH